MANFVIVFQMEEFKTHGMAFFISEFASLFFIWLWPAVKSLAAYKIDHYVGRFSVYWIGASLLTAIYLLIRPLLLYLLPFAYIVPIISFILSFSNGFLMRQFVENGLLRFYSAYINELNSIPSFVSAKVKQILNSPTVLLKAALNRSSQEQPKAQAQKPTFQNTNPFEQ